MHRLPVLTLDELSPPERREYDETPFSFVETKLVYVAGPLFSSGTSSNNIRNALAVGHQIRAVGLTPFVPHLFHLWDTIFPRPGSYWLSLDREVLTLCAAMVVLPGYSRGVRCERVWAGDKPVFELTPEEVVASLAWGRVDWADMLRSELRG